MTQGRGDQIADWRLGPSMLTDLPLGALALGPDGTVAYGNDAVAALLGVPAGRLVGAALVDLVAAGNRGGATEVLRRTLGGARWSGELHLLCQDGRTVELSTSWSPLTTGAGERGALVLLDVDRSTSAGVPDQPGSPARLASARLTRLAIVTESLLGCESVDQVATVVTEEVSQAAGATVGSISLLVDDRTLALVGIRGGPEDARARWATYSLDSDTPAAEAVRTRDLVVLSSRAQIEQRYPDLELAADGERSMVCLPLLAGSRDLGVIGFSFPQRRTIDPTELHFFRLLAATCAQAIDRIQAQAATADREAKLRFLADATATLAGDLDHEATLDAVAHAAVPWFADWCAIALEEDGRLRTLSVAHAHPEHAELVHHLQTRYPPSPHQERGSYRVLRTGVSDLVPEITDEILALSAQDEEHLRLLRLLDFRSAMACPLAVQDRVLGVVTWVTGASGRRFTAEDLAFGEDLARRAAVAIDNAQLHSQLRTVALELQHAVLPDRLPEVAGWSAEVSYLPAGRTETGGDFYDLVDLEDGRLAMFVGDVMGRGVGAASVMAQMRASLRTLIALDADPATVMSRLDDVHRHLGLDHLVTAVYLLVDTATGVVDVVSAGHPEAVVVRGDGTVESVQHEQTLLLGAGGGERTVTRLALHSGDTVLTYSDGLVERRGEDLGAGARRLHAACGAHASAGLRTFVDEVVAITHDQTRDDDVVAFALRRD